MTICGVDLTAHLPWLGMMGRWGRDEVWEIARFNCWGDSTSLDVLKVFDDGGDGDDDDDDDDDDNWDGGDGDSVNGDGDDVDDGDND